MRPLPELCQATLDRALLDQLVADIAALTQVVQVQTKGAARAYAAGSSLSLAEGVERLTSGAARGLQICYVHENQAWSDTLIATPKGYRLVRTQPDMDSTTEKVTSR